MYALKCLTLTAAADARAQVMKNECQKMGFRFTSKKGVHSFEPIKELKKGDFVVQPLVGAMPSKTVVFFDESSMKEGYGQDIDWNGEKFVFTQSSRRMPTDEELKQMAKKAKNNKKKESETGEKKPKKTKDPVAPKETHSASTKTPRRAKSAEKISKTKN